MKQANLSGISQPAQRYIAIRTNQRGRHHLIAPNFSSALPGLVSAAVAVAATDLPAETFEQKFVKYALFGASLGATGRVFISAVKGSKPDNYRPMTILWHMMPSFYLALASWAVGMTGALLCYTAGVINGHDGLKIATWAAVSSMFGLLLEQLGGEWIKARAKREIRNNNE